MLKNKILAGYAAGWMIIHFAWVVIAFYLANNSPYQQNIYSIASLVVWLITLAIALLILLSRTISIDRALEQLEKGKKISNEELKTVFKRSLNLPIYGGVLFAIMFGVYILIMFILMSIYGPFGSHTFYALLVPGIAGMTACPSMVVGIFGLIIGRACRPLSLELRKRKIKSSGIKFSLRDKLLIAFIGFTIGYGVWVGGLGYYNGLNQAIEEIKSSSLEIHEVIIDNIKLRDGRMPTIERLKPIINEIKIDKNGFAFLANRQGKIVYNPRQEEIFVERWTGINTSLIEGIKSGQPGNIYENINERIISYSPINSEYILGTISYLKDKESRSAIYWIWLGVFVLGAVIVGVVLGGTFSVWTSRSVNRVSSVLKKVTGGDFSKRVPTETEDEVAELIDSCNIMTSSLSGYKRKLEQSKAEIENIIQGQTDLVFVVSTKGVILRVNKTVLNVLGYNADEIIGKAVTMVFHPDTMERDIEAGPKKALMGKVVTNTELVLKHKDGRKLPFSFNGTPLKDDQGKIIGAIGVGRDLREIKKLITQLKEAKSGLENKVEERTKELEEAKTSLEIKVRARTKDLEEAKTSLEEQVNDRTKELQKKLEELEKFNKLAVDRELKMIELKKEIKKLKSGNKG